MLGVLRPKRLPADANHVDQVRAVGVCKGPEALDASDRDGQRVRIGGQVPDVCRSVDVAVHCEPGDRCGDGSGTEYDPCAPAAEQLRACGPRPGGPRAAGGARELRRLQPCREGEKNGGEQRAPRRVKEKLGRHKAACHRRADEEHQRPVIRVGPAGGTPHHEEGPAPECKVGQHSQGSRGRGHLDELAVRLVVRLRNGSVPGSEPAEHCPVIVRPPAQQRAIDESVQARVPGCQTALHAPRLQVHCRQAVEGGCVRGIGCVLTVGIHALGIRDPKSDHQDGDRECSQGTCGHQAPDSAGQHGPGERQKADGCERSHGGTGRPGQQQHPEVEPGAESPREPMDPPEFAGRGQVRPDCKPAADEQVREHVDAEVGRVVEGPAHARQMRLGQRAEEGNPDAQVPGEDDASHGRAHAAGKGEQRPQRVPGADHRHQDQGEREPVGQIHHPLHAFVVGPEAALKADPRGGREHRDPEAGSKQERQPGPGRTICGIGQREEDPQREDDLDERSRPDRLADHERVDGGLSDHKRGEEHEADADENHPPRDPAEPPLPGRRSSPCASGAATSSSCAPAALLVHPFPHSAGPCPVARSAS